MRIAWDRARWAFSAGVILLLLIATVAGVMIVQLQSANRRIMHAFETQVALQQVDEALGSAGRARVIYINSKNPQDLAESEARIARAQTLMQGILQETARIGVHETYDADLAKLVDRRVAILRASTRGAENGRADVDAQADYTRQIAVVGDQINSAIDQMEAHEQDFAERGRLVSERLFTAIAIVLVCAFAFSIGLLYMDYRYLRRELAERLRAEQSALDSRESLRLLSVRLLRTQDEQSRKFSRELHDSLGQYLSLVKMNLSRYARTAPPDELLAECIDMVERCIAESRTMSYLLHPPLLDDMGFRFAARWYLEGFASRSGIEVNADIPDDAGRLPLSVEVTLFRVLQECLTNIHRHSGSKRADVSLSVSPSTASLRIRDYGKGIPSALLRQFLATGGNVGVGLAGMRERVREQGGQMDIESSSQGAVISVRIPATVLAESAVAD